MLHTLVHTLLIIHIRGCVLLRTSTTAVLVDLPRWCSFLEGNIPLSSTLTGPVKTYQVHTCHMYAYLSAGPPAPRTGHYWSRCGHQWRRRCWYCGLHHHTFPSTAVHQYCCRGHILLTSITTDSYAGCWFSTSHYYVLVCA